MAKNTSAQPVEIVEAEGLAEIAGLNHVIDALTAIRDSRLPSLKQILSTYFFEEARNSDNFPRTFVAEDGLAKAECTLRRKGANRKLSEQDLRKITAAGIIPTMGKKVTRINPQYMEDERFIKALQKVIETSEDDVFPDDLFETVPAGVIIDDKLVLRVLQREDLDETSYDLLATVADIVVSKFEIRAENPMTTAIKMIEEHLPQSK